MPYFGLRLTLGEIFSVPDEQITNHHHGRIAYLIKHIIREKIQKDSEYVCGLETLNKFGEKTKMHYHFNFISDSSLETLRKAIVRKTEALDYKLKGNKMYCLQSFPEPKDYHRWFRYPMKENFQKLYTLYRPDKNEPTLEQLEMLAKDERKQTVAANIKLRSKQLDKRTYFDKIVKHLEKKNLKKHRDIYIEIAKFYVKDGKPVNSQTIKGYTNNYMLMNSIMSYDEFYDINNKYN